MRTRSLLLPFHAKTLSTRASDPREGLSSAAYREGALWTAADDGAWIERFAELNATGFTTHEAFELRRYLPLPAGPLDLEGLDVDNGKLWLLGSHARQRRKPEKNFSNAGHALRALAKVNKKKSSRLLACLALEGGRPRAGSGVSLASSAGENAFTRALARDPHFGPFTGLPGKDNGLELEGLAAHGDRLFLGVRGPVLRGWACVLSVRTEETAGELRLVRKRRGRLFAKHFLYCDGMGIRELERQGEDLFLIAGPTSVLDAPLFLYRWPGGARPRGDSITRREELEFLWEVPRPRGKDAGRDRAEGLTVLKRGKERELLVVYDNASRGRRRAGGAYVADCLKLTGRRRRAVRPDSTP